MHDIGRRISWALRPELTIVALIIVAGLLAGRYGRSAYDSLRMSIRSDPATIHPDSILSTGLILIARGDCPACSLITPVWERLARRIPSGTPVRLITPTTDGGPQTRLNVDRIRYERAAPEALAGVGVKVVPTTIVVDTAGRLVLLEEGHLSERRLQSIERLLK